MSHRAYLDGELIGSYPSAEKAVEALKQALPPATECPHCHSRYAEFICHLCKTDKRKKDS